MKKFTSLAILLMILLAANIHSQGFNYQTVLRNSSGTVESTTAVVLKFSVLQGSSTGSEVYAESHDITTNTYGIISVVVGQGTVLNGDFALIDWSNGPYYLNVDIDGEDMGTSQLNSVPYANHANMAETALTADVATTAGSATTATTATTATNADHATTSDNATSADHADTADEATNADHANTADNATTATIAGTANKAKDLEITGATSGDIIYYNGTNWVRLAKGTSGQVLTVESGVPAWKDASTGSDGPQIGDTYDDGIILEIYPDGDVLLVYNTQITQVVGPDVYAVFNYSTAQTLVPSGWSIPTLQQFSTIESRSTLLPSAVWPNLNDDLLFWTSTDYSGGGHFSYYNGFYTALGDATACRLIVVKKVPYL